ncbi:hypothetical protein GCM10010191_00160 [Actinomadura vinacea]|uniref:Major facilitator superfamily (MFS) profile domain-containing protein n=1 Tax=Actinomadura vinacea TaxID=115336 RepID=A0ABN3IAI6_9ACTN
MNCDRVIAAIAKANVRANGGGIAQGIGFGAVFGAVLGGVDSVRLDGFSGGTTALVAGMGAITGAMGAVFGTWLLRGLTSGTVRGGVRTSKLAALVIAVLIVAGIASLILVRSVVLGEKPAFNVVVAGSFFVGGVLAMLNARP